MQNDFPLKKSFFFSEDLTTDDCICFSAGEVDGPGVLEGPPLHQQVRRVELRGPAVGDGHTGGRPLPWGPARETDPPPGGGIQDEQTETLQSEYVSHQSVIKLNFSKSNRIYMILV